MDIILFVYGLSFFVLGALVLSANPKESHFFFAKRIWLLGVFAILHAIVEWISLYQYIYPETKSFLIHYELILLLLSYLFLFEFARFIMRNVFASPKTKLHFIHSLFAAPVIYTIGTTLLLALIILDPQLNEAIVAIRYTYGFWGALYVGIGLYAYGMLLKKMHHVHALRLDFKIAGLAFIAYAFFGGVVVPPVDHFPSNIINTIWFMETFHVPVQLFRSICAVVIAFSSIKALEIFRFEIIERLNESSKRIKEFNSNASHQIKTPLASMKVQIDVTLQKEREADEYKQVLHSIGDEIGTLQKMVSSLLLLTRMDDDSIKDRFKDLEVDGLLLDIIGEYMLLATQKGVTLEIEELDPLHVKGDETLLPIMLTNLIDNALKYTPKGKKITLSLKKRQLIIKDEGIGITKANQPHVFEKFFQVTSGTKEQTSGFGLGLTMVKKIALLHAISLDLQSVENEGTTITISF